MENIMISTIERGKPILIILIGPPGSGKTTLRKNLVDNLSSLGHSVKGICQDEVPGRKSPTVKKRVWRYLKEGYIVILDRCNHCKKQRESFLAMGKRHGAKIYAIVFETPEDECIRRASIRAQKDPTHSLPLRNVVKVIHRFWWEMSYPTKKEGFLQIFFVNEDGINIPRPQIAIKKKKRARKCVTCGGNFFPKCKTHCKCANCFFSQKSRK